MFESFQKKYFDIPLSRGLVSLYTSKTIMMIASALLGLFLPIFLFELFRGNLRAVAIFYVLGYLPYAFLVVIGAQFLNRFGFRRSLRLSVVFGALYYFLFYYIDRESWVYLIPLAVVILLFFRLTYWLPYHVDFAKFGNKKNRGRQVSLFWATRFVLGIFLPVIAGLLISRFGFEIVFIIAIILYLVSGIPFLTIPETYEKFSWSFMETWRQVFSKARRRLILAYFAAGAESIVGFVIWPIFIYQLLEGNYFSVGAVSTLILAATAVLQLMLGKYIDLKTPKEKVLSRASVFYAAGWVFKIFIATAFQIFIVGAYHRIARVFLRTPFDTLTYEIAADQGHYVDEFTVLHEIAINAGKAFMLILVMAASFFFALQWIFLLAALAAIFYNLLIGQRASLDKRHQIHQAF